MVAPSILGTPFYGDGVKGHEHVRVPLTDALNARALAGEVNSAKLAARVCSFGICKTNNSIHKSYTRM